MPLPAPSLVQAVAALGRYSARDADGHGDDGGVCARRGRRAFDQPRIFQRLSSRAERGISEVVGGPPEGVASERSARRPATDGQGPGGGAAFVSVFVNNADVPLLGRGPGREVPERRGTRPNRRTAARC